MQPIMIEQKLGELHKKVVLIKTEDFISKEKVPNYVESTQDRVSKTQNLTSKISTLTKQMLLESTEIVNGEKWPLPYEKQDVFVEFTKICQDLDHPKLYAFDEQIIKYISDLLKICFECYQAVKESDKYEKTDTLEHILRDLTNDQLFIRSRICLLPIVVNSSNFCVIC
jgi:hypothetical protein